ncbi:hypothetical protein [Adlercreutzia sp. ZJ154]|uniref:hypothetical protein n=1 Tax=Adlercreutzia sp. ZJ154 TaxID=2709790 RepID=UPI0013EC54D0|nr:hypothetical protein [Adlercreutzia sp. ZJ154]
MGTYYKDGMRAASTLSGKHATSKGCAMGTIAISNYKGGATAKRCYRQGETMLTMLSSGRHQLWRNTGIRGFVRMVYNAFGANLVPRLVPTWCQGDSGHV